MKFLRRAALTGTALLLAWAALICFPQPMFSSTLHAGHLTLHSDQPIPAEAARRVLALAESKLAKSPLWTSQRDYDIYICNARWRQAIFFNKDYGVGGVSPYPLTSNVFLRDARIDTNQLISPRGTPVAADRSLDYFIAHEVTHVLTGSVFGLRGNFALPQWVREGYADHIGKNSEIDLEQSRHSFLSNAEEMDYAKSGLYRRFHLLVAWQLRRQNQTLDELLYNPPSQQSVEAALSGVR